MRREINFSLNKKGRKRERKKKQNKWRPQREIIAKL